MKSGSTWIRLSLERIPLSPWRWHLPSGSLTGVCTRFARTWKRTRHAGLHQLAMTLTHSQSTRVLLCVDQFEELFTQTSAQEEREQFLELLVTALSEPRGPVIVVLTLRADFYDRVLNSSVLWPAHRAAPVRRTSHERPGAAHGDRAACSVLPMCK